VFDAPVWVADDRAAASCSFAAVWLADWTPTAPDGQHAPVPPPPDWVCAAPWFDEFAFDAAAAESALFVCETAPSLPGLRTRTEMFVLLGLVCAAPDAAAAACALDADWSTVWMPSVGVAATARLTPVVRERTLTASAMRHRFIYVSLSVSMDNAPGRAPGTEETR
jgi:hypothetical protein